SALMGIAGAYLAEILCTWSKTQPMARRSALIQILIMIFAIMLLSWSPYVDFGAHLGGLLVGTFIGVLWFTRLHLESPLHKQIGMGVGALLLLVYFVMGFILFFTVIDVAEGEY